ncbi:MAG: rod shape determining protein RodA [Petroclostridium sp.]|jgi:rod shape determining protein RodA|uniref:rod shape-determining protein RodA n=1 Tax=Petroclostridium xylanilyticum TaxID=1792311 RepID=UPI000B98CE72|nr:rod shape-determining protein RodA [Petroclostridium xylanilyticum]MBZ4645014.1 rod shape-determining protein RodA [Clostridia bacterium]MDK2810059.1 rod shape determining protein RodA [Petroclostridium sp.]
MFDKKLLRNLDTITIIIVVILVSVGIVAISSATHVHETGDYWAVKRQIMWFVAGLIAMVVVMSIDYNTLGNLSVYMYFFSLLLLVAVLIPGVGVVRNGARSWFDIKVSLIQPAEFIKIIMIITFSKHIEKIKESNESDINSIKNLCTLVAHMALPIFLILKQPDWGTAAVFIGIMIVILFIAGISYKYIVAAFATSAAVLPLLFFFVMKEYQRERLLVFWDPNRDPLGRGYHVIQSKIAIGSGQLYGKGLFHGTQTHLGYLPEQHTDFIFSVIGEELGFIWSSIIIILFVILLLRFLYLATLAKEDFGSYIIIGITAMIFFHILINIGMTMGLAPVTGIPLPFISYGGSSLLTNMMAIGLVLNVAMRRQKINF